MRRIADFLTGPIEVLPFESEDAEEAGDIRAALERKGTPIGPYDLLIAAQARRRNALLVTANGREFWRVPGLRCEDWAASGFNEDWQEAEQAELKWQRDEKQRRRRKQLEEDFVQTIAEDFDGRVLDLDQAAAEKASALCAERQLRGRPVDMRDTLIASIAVSRRAQLATRNVKNFEDLEVAVINFWAA